MSATRQEVLAAIRQYRAAQRYGRHDDVARLCTQFAQWGDELKAEGVECPADANGVRWSVDQIADMVLGPRKSYRERREAKAERLREWADKREVKAETAYSGVQAITDRIPFGQPILVGHHSERGARADQRRIERGMDAACENSAKASEFRSRADNIERAAKQAIYSDDEDAGERLAEKLAKLEAQREHIKATNAAYRKEHKVELKALDSAYARDRAMPYPSYVLQNLGGNISRTRKRLAAMT